MLKLLILTLIFLSLGYISAQKYYDALTAFEFDLKYRIERSSESKQNLEP